MATSAGVADTTALAHLDPDVVREMVGAMPGVVLLLRVESGGELAMLAANRQGAALFGDSSENQQTPRASVLPTALHQLVANQLTAAPGAEDVVLSADSVYEMRVLRLAMDEGQCPLVMCVGRDVSAERAVTSAAEILATELQRSNDDLQKFAYIASHDLSEPLRMVSSFVELLGSRYRGQLDARADEYIRFAVEGTHRMRALIDDLLAVATIRTTEHEPRPVDLGEVVADVLDDLQSLAQQSGAQISVGPLPRVSGDAVQLRQVMQNVLTNSMKFHIDPTVKIRIGAQVIDGRCRVTIDDDGIGIEEQHRKRAFDMFTRLNPRGVFAGNGIGLGMTHRIVEAHGGAIWIERSDLGGARVVFTLPLVQSEPSISEEVR